MLSEKALKKIEQEIKDQLTKRSIFVELELEEVQDRLGRTMLRLSSTEFQTVPAIFRTLGISDFGTSIEERNIEDGNPLYDVYITVNVWWRGWERGSNGTTLFTFKCTASEDDIYSVQIF